MSRFRKDNRLLAGGIAIAALSGILATVAVWHHRPPSALPMPKDIAALEPQLRDYLAEQFHWIQQSPRDAQRHSVLGLIYLANGMLVEAKAAFENAAHLNTKDPLALLYAGVATQEMGDLAHALEIYKQVVRRFPNFAPGLFRFGDTLLRTGATEEAARIFSRLIVIAPGEWQGYAGLADTKIRKGQYLDATTLLERAVGLNPEAKIARHLLGLAYRGMGQTEEAGRELRRGLNAQHYPMDDAWNVTLLKYSKRLPDQVELAQAYLQSGRSSEAIKLLESCLKWHSNNFALAVQLGDAYNRAGQPDKARQIALKVVEAQSNYLAAYYTLMDSCLAMGISDEALGYAERAIELAPEEAQPYIAKARTLLFADRNTEALAAFQEAVVHDPKNPYILMDLGDLCLRLLDKPQEALTYFKQANELDPSLVPILVRLTDICLRLGQLAEAGAWLEKVRKQAPDEPLVNVLESRLTHLERRESVSVLTNHNSKALK